MRNLLPCVLTVFVTCACVVAVEATNTCVTAECVRLARVYTGNMNRNADPCNNFYNYVCEKWPKQNPRPRYKHEWNLDRSMRHRVVNELRKLLEAPDLSLSTQVRRAKALYKSCLKLPFLERVDVNAVKKIMSEIGNWPMFFPIAEAKLNYPWWKIDNAYIKKTGESAIFDTFLIASAGTDQNILQVQRMNSPYGAMKRMKIWSTSERDHYKNFLKEIIIRVAPRDPKPYMHVIERDLENVLKLREIMRRTANSATTGCQRATIANLQDWYNGHVKSKPNLEINWLEQFRAFLVDGKGPYPTYVNENTQISTQAVYFADLVEELQNITPRVIANHIHLYFAETHLILDSKMQEELKLSFTEGVEETGMPARSFPKYYKCIIENSLQVTLGRMYVEKFFPPSARIDVQVLLEKTKRLMIDDIGDSNWLDRVMKKMTQEKIKDMKYQIGYPDWIKVAGAPEQLEYRGNPLEPESINVVTENKVYLSAAHLQWPIFSQNLPYVINYGATGTLIGHELYHAVDSRGVEYDKNGLEMWWPNDMIEAMKKQLKCFREPYDKYKRMEVQKFNLPVTVKLPKTFNEDMADVMGLKTAYKMYQAELKKNGGSCQVLPGFEKDGCEQLFFIAFANIFCSVVSPMLQEHLLLTDDHSSNPIRLNSAVSHMKEFGKAFKCTGNYSLQVAKPCDLWEKFV